MDNEEHRPEMLDVPMPDVSTKEVNN
jgi:hypothetical protein